MRSAHSAKTENVSSNITLIDYILDAYNGCPSEAIETRVSVYCL